MTRNTLITLSLALIFLIGQSCNPDCNSASTQNINIASGQAIQAGRDNQVLLRSQPASFVKDREVFMDDPIKGFPNRIRLTSTFTNELGGVIVDIPENVAMVSTPALYVDDPDCSSDVILVNTLPIRTEEFFFFSDNFIVPPAPIIIIPGAAVPPPINIENAWITPYERGYCIWFVPERDEDDNEASVLRPYKPGIDEMDVMMGKIDLIGSREFVVCGSKGVHNNADLNPVSGFVDRASGAIEITIDRTDKGLGEERFTGQFITPENIPTGAEWRNGTDVANGDLCSTSTTDVKEDFMLLTSQKTGQQVLMIKATPRN